MMLATVMLAAVMLAAVMILSALLVSSTIYTASSVGATTALNQVMLSPMLQPTIRLLFPHQRLLLWSRRLRPFLLYCSQPYPL
jgi:hypothetical protein